MNQPLVRYPNRTVYFGVATGLLDPEKHAASVEADRVKRLESYNLLVESLEDFKERFGICLR